jgi:quercetin dioxygenase-like cupin family protein
MKRYHENPVIKDKVNFVKLTTDTNGEYTLGEFELAAGGGNPPHYHDTFQEKFHVLEGELTVRINGKRTVLKAGESAIALPGQKHNFANRTNAPVKFLVELRPGNAGFEKAIAIAYGLARDGETNKAGLPRKLPHMALLTTMSDGRLPGVFYFLGVLFRYVARRAERNGELKQLTDRYCN